MRRNFCINEKNLSSMENLYTALVRVQTFEGAESAYKPRITKDQRICHWCGMKGHKKRFCGNNRYMDNSRPYNRQQTERLQVAFANMAEKDYKPTSMYNALSAYEIIRTVIINSGCSQHMTNSERRLFDIRDCHKTI
jgi:hypothetical protein